MPSPSSIFKTTLDRSLIIFGLLLGAVFAAYSPVLNGQFIWDDGYLVGENPLFRSPVFTLEVFRHYLYVDSLAVYYRPVQNLSFILDYWLWHDNPCGYHLTNILLHGASAFLLFCLLRRILPNLIGQDIASPEKRVLFAKCSAFCVSLVWAIHPIHNAAVAYISGRADSLIAFFILSAWLLFLKSEGAAGTTRWLLRLLALCSALLGLGSKEAGLLWIILFLLWIFGFCKAPEEHVRLHAAASQRPPTGQEPQFSRGKKAAILGFLLLLVGAYWLLRQLPGPRPSPDIGAGEPFLNRVLLMFRALGDYTGLIFWPSQLHMERMLGSHGPYPNVSAWVAAIRGEYLSILGLLALGSFAWGVSSKKPGRMLRIFGVVWFLIGFIPISNLLPLNAQAAEHWIYMPSIGFLVFLAGVVLAIPNSPFRRAELFDAGKLPLEQNYDGGRRVAPPSRLGPKLASAVSWQSALFACALLATIPLGIRTAYRSADWADSEKLFKQTALAGGGTQRVHLNLANLSTSKGSLEEGERHLRFTLAHFPDYVPARINLAINLLKQKKEAEAEKLLTFDHASAVQAAKDYAHTWSAPLNLARLRFSQNRPQEALAILNEAIEIQPKIWELVALKAQIMKQTQGPAAAIPPVQAYANERWWHFGASMMLGELRAANHETEAALQAWNAAARLDIHSSEPFAQIAKFEANQNHLQQALNAADLAIQREPEQASNYLLLATILHQMNRPAESEAALRHVEELRNAAK